MLKKIPEGFSLMSNKKKSEELVNKALKLDMLKDGDSYAKLLKQSIDANPAGLKAHVLLGNYYFKKTKRDDKSADEYLSKVVKIDYLVGSDQVEASKVYISLGRINQELGNKDESLNYYKDFIGLFPFSPTADKVARQIYVKLKNFDEWFATYKKGMTFFEEANYEQAMKSFKSCQKSNPSFPWPSFFLARSLFIEGKYSEAQVIFEKLYDQRSFYVFAYYLYLAKKEATAASDRGLLDFIKESAPYFAPALLEYGKMEESEQNYTEAVNYYNQVKDFGDEKLESQATDLLENISDKKNSSKSDSDKSGKETDSIINDAMKEAESITMDAYAEAKVIKDTAQKEADEILKEAKQKAKESKNTSTPSGSLSQTDLPVHLKERFRKKLRELEDCYDKMVKELNDERKKLRYKALDDAEEILKAAEKHRSDIIAKAHEEAESIVKSVSMMAERERQHVYDKTLKYSVIAIEEAREKAVNDGKDLIRNAEKERDSIHDKAVLEAKSMIEKTEKLSEAYLENALGDISKISDDTVKSAKEEIDEICNDLIDSFTDFLTKGVTDIKKTFVSKTEKSLEKFSKSFSSSSEKAKSNFNAADAISSFKLSAEEHKFSPEMEDPEKMAKPFADKALMGEDSSFPVVGDVVKDVLDQSKEISAPDFSESEESDFMGGKDDFLDRFVSQKELFEDIDITDLSGESQDEQQTVASDPQDDIETNVRESQDGAKDETDSALIASDEPLKLTEDSVFGDTPPASDGTLFGDTVPVSESIFDGNSSESGSSAVFGDAPPAEHDMFASSQDDSSKIFGEESFSQDGLEKSDEKISSEPVFGSALEEPSTLFADSPFANKTEDEEPSPFSGEPAFFSLESEETTEQETTSEEPTVFSPESSDSPFTVWQPSSTETEQSGAQSDVSEENKAAGSEEESKDGEKDFGSFISSKYAELMDDDDEEED